MKRTVMSHSNRRVQLLVGIVCTIVFYLVVAFWSVWTLWMQEAVETAVHELHLSPLFRLPVGARVERPRPRWGHSSDALSVGFDTLREGTASLCDATYKDWNSRDFQHWNNVRATLNQGPFLSGDDVVEKISGWKEAKTQVQAEALTSSRIMCVVTTVESVSRLAAVATTWAKDCDDFRYTNVRRGSAHVTSVAEQAIRTIRDEVSQQFPRFSFDTSVVNVSSTTGQTMSAWQRLRHTLRNTYEEQHERPRLQQEGSVVQQEYFLFTGDDTLVVAENLREMLRESSLQHLTAIGTPLFLGHRMVATFSSSPFISSTAFLLNRYALQLFHAISMQSGCSPNVDSEQEDLLLAACFGAYGVQALNTQDVFGEDRVLLFSPGVLHIVSIFPDKTPWYEQYRGRKAPSGRNATSLKAWAIHGVSGTDLQTLHENKRKRQG